MALYIPASKRRRRSIVVGVSALLVGLVIGLLIGRLAAPSVGESVRAKQNDAEDLIARLDGLQLEYQQTGGGAAGAADARQGSIDAVRDLVADSAQLVQAMPWVPASERTAVVAAVRVVQTDVEQGVPAGQLTTAVGQAEVGLRAAAGLASPS